MYRPRNPRASPLFQLFETHYETVKSVWEERFERQYGFWQGRWDRAVAAYQDCGLFGRTLTRPTYGGSSGALRFRAGLYRCEPRGVRLRSVCGAHCDRHRHLLRRAGDPIDCVCRRHSQNGPFRVLPPCGNCRRLLLDFAPNAMVVLGWLFGLVIIGVELSEKASQVVHFRRAVDQHVSAQLERDCVLRDELGTRNPIQDTFFRQPSDFDVAQPEPTSHLTAGFRLPDRMDE